MSGLFSTRNLPIATAISILVLLWTFGALRHDYFASPATVSNLLADYAFVAIAAIGATFVILSGGIDLSVGSVVAFTAALTAFLVGAGWHPLAAAAVCLAIGTSIGITVGMIIHAFELPPFMVTLAAMFAIRAGGFLILSQSQGFSHDFLPWLSRAAIVELPGGLSLQARSLLMLTLFVLAWLVAARMPVGRNVYAIGGSEKAARMMGVPIGRTKVAVYAIAGFCSALAGVVLVLYKRAGDPSEAIGLELAVIASVVIGGTLLSGGVGSIFGTFIGVMILGVIRMLIDFEGNLNSAWTSIAIGGLLLIFVCMQNLIAWVSLRAAARFRRAA
ncbi:MAG: sugar ABC transporter permease [Planctomycetota bacterium]